MTERLYYTDSYLSEFRARVLEVSGDGSRVVLDRTAFYPASGGQPHDLGVLGGVRVAEVLDEEERIVHVLESPLPQGGEVAGTVDWPRRFDHMQQHSGQHLLSAVFDRLFGFRTVSFHLGGDLCTIDLATASVEPDQLKAAERRANELVQANLPLSVSFEESGKVAGLRKESDREGTLRIVSIQGFDRSACGGTHVRATGEIGPILTRKIEKIRGNVRVEFLCGIRASDRARADYEALSKIARLFSSTPDEAPELVAGQLEQAREAAKSRLKLAIELASWKGRALYDQSVPDSDGRRRHLERRTKGALDDELRTMAQGFCAGQGAVFLAVSENPPSALLAVAADTGLHAGNILKEALAAAGGRGGGNAQLAQGSLGSAEAFPALIELLAHL